MVDVDAIIFAENSGTRSTTTNRKYISVLVAAIMNHLYLGNVIWHGVPSAEK